MKMNDIAITERDRRLFEPVSSTPEQDARLVKMVKQMPDGAFYSFLEILAACCGSHTASREQSAS